MLIHVGTIGDTLEHKGIFSANWHSGMSLCVRAMSQSNDY
jgi:hypothetical protein